MQRIYEFVGRNCISSVSFNRKDGQGLIRVAVPGANFISSRPKLPVED